MGITDTDQADLLASQVSAADQVSALYRAHGMDLVRIAAVMLGSRAAAEDAVRPLDLESPEQTAILGEEHRDVLAALSRLPHRQREALVLRYFLDLPEAEIATAMGITQGTVKSTTSRALAALSRLLEERS